jgi:hypothetical protein
MNTVPKNDDEGCSETIKKLENVAIIDTPDGCR